MDNIRNDHIRGTAQVDCFGDEADQVCTWMLKMKPPGMRKRGRPHGTFTDSGGGHAGVKDKVRVR